MGKKSSKSGIVDDEKRPSLVIYTDGCCWPNDGTGAGGWAWVCLQTDDWVCDGDKPTTNNRMELQAILEALQYAKERNPDGLTDIVSDSQYAVNGCNSWRLKWKKNGWQRKKWKKKGMQPVKNADLWQAIDAILCQISCKLRWVRGHDGNHWNEKADRLASRGARNLTRQESPSLTCVGSC